MTNGADWMPVELTPQTIGVSPDANGLIEYLSDSKKIENMLHQQKALVFRQFSISAEKLKFVLDLLLNDRLSYVNGNSPRTKVGDNIYTSTEYPPEFNISMHNELSYAASWPARLLFFCEVAPTTGGATPVTDGHRWLCSLDSEVRGAFAGGIRYVQNLHGGRGPGRSWQDTFETSDQELVEAYLSSADAAWEWTKSGLRVSQVRPATVHHPKTGREVWFNQADQWHAATLDKETTEALMELMPEEDWPQSVQFADGSPIPREYALHVRDRGYECSVDVNWQAGDVLLIDNVLVAHGRRSFTGSRRVLVAMSS